MLRISSSARLFYVTVLSAVVVNSFAIAGDLNMSLKSSQTLAYGNQNSDMLYLDLVPEFDIKISSRWQTNLSFRLENSGADFGLGTRETFDNISKPIKLDDDTHAEIDTAVITWRKRSTRLVFGKQTFAWGVLDGIQVTDRFDASRKRQAIFIEQRPDRIARWGARTQFTYASFRWDVGFILDSTADQLASPGTTYEAVASRFRGGVSADIQVPDLQVKLSDNPTFGLRASKRFGNQDGSILFIHGPDTEPVFTISANGIELNYDNRTLVGSTYQQSQGNKVWRVELATIFDQPVNTRVPELQVDKRQRYLGGVGVDWQLSDNALMNIQLGFDHIAGNQLVRPNTDIVATVKIQQPFYNDTVKLSAEWLSSLKDSDGTFRPAIAWHYNDSLTIKGGIDIIWGDREDLIGQFSDRDKLYLSLHWAF